MFEDEYKRAIDEIRADCEVKKRIAEKISRKPTRKFHVKRASALRIAAAFAACVAVVFSAVIINRNNSSTGNFEKTVTYGEIYDTVNEFAKQAKKENVVNGLTSAFNGLFSAKARNADEYTVEDYYAIDDGTTTDSESYTEKSSADTGSYSETNTQVEGVKESDIVKTDGEYIYCLTNNKSYEKKVLRIIKPGKKPEVLSSTEIDGIAVDDTAQIYLSGKRVIIFGQSPSQDSDAVKTLIYGTESPEKPERLYECEQSGYYCDSRLIGDCLYIISNYYVPLDGIKKASPKTYIPSISCEDYNSTVEAESVCVASYVKNPEYTVICCYSVKDGTLLGTKSLLGGTYTVYCSTENIITAGYSNDDKTAITRFSLSDGKIELKAEGNINGELLNQFSIDEHNGYFRFVTTLNSGKETRNGNLISYKIEKSNSLYVLNGELKKVGAVEKLAEDEQVYSVRFMGDIAYFVTFRQVDPLFSADLSDPENPKIIGKLKIPGFSNYLFPFGNGKLLGIGSDADENTGSTRGIKLSLFDISNPASVTESAKTVLDVNYSEALYSHKASVVDAEKGLIGFPTHGNTGSEYRIFGFENGKFEQKAQIKLGETYSGIRGLYIDDFFYIVTDKCIFAYNMTDYVETAKISF